MEKTWAIIDGASRKVVNIIVAEEAWITLNLPGAIRRDTLTPQPQIGWSYDGTNFAPPAE